MKIYNNPLYGSIDIIKSKSYYHRILIASFLAHSKNEYISFSEDTATTFSAIKTLENDQNILKMNSSATTLRLLIPVLSVLTGKEYTFIMNDDLSKRPLDVYEKIYKDHNLLFNKENNKLTISGSLKSGDYIIDGRISSQFVSGLLMALPLLPGDSKIIIENDLESRNYCYMTLDVLREFGIDIHEKNNTFYIKGNQEYRDTKMSLEGDYSQGAFFIAAGLFSKYLKIKGLNPISIQGDRAIIKVVRSFKGDIYFNKQNELIIHKSKLKAAKIDLRDCIDLAPIVFVMAAYAKGKSKITGIKRLVYKESDRLKAMLDAFETLNIKVIKISDNEIEIEGRPEISGNVELKTHNDHRIIMALSVLATNASNPVTLDYTAGVKKSYPEFFTDFKELNGKTGE